MSSPALAAALLALAGCAFPYTPPALSPITQPAPAAAGQVAEARAPIVVLVSIDGFRPDYLGRGVTPTLSQLAAEGVSAAMRPSFPTKTYPNHWSLVTGLRPDRSGIVANTMEDASRPGETFTMASDDPFWWNAAEPIWVTAEKAGVRTAAMFWPGAGVGWGGVRDAAWPHEVAGGTRPADWWPYGEAVSNAGRVRGVLDWLRRPAETRPRFVTLYFDTVDTAGHRFGPDDARTTEAIAEVDAPIGELVAGLATLGQPADLVIVADHGMAATSSTRVVALDTLLQPADARTVETGPYAGIVPAPGREAAVAAALLRPHPHMTCWRKADIPARFHYGANPRVPPFLCLAGEGWEVLRTAPTTAYAKGGHGYDNDLPDMRALFIANGPSFEGRQRLPSFDNVDVAPLLRDLLGLPTGTGLDGTDRPFRRVLRR